LYTGRVYKKPSCFEEADILQRRLSERSPTEKLSAKEVTTLVNSGCIAMQQYP
jgi:hypothetical protein